ncbi:MAG: phytanoyl-CoA dioxygenase family protein [Planctomycetaceae bacterium]|nr:phytanoyl-CoA dioxygenase family protein [Planctomycetaceae bacterium]
MSDSSGITPVVQKPDLKSHVEREGYAVISECIPLALIEKLCSLTDAARNQGDSELRVTSAGGTFALRNLTDAVPQVCELLRVSALRQIIREVVSDPAFLVRATLFDKTPGSNWGVFWHQDLSIAVREKHEMSGFHAWTRKAGVQTVQPPTAIMEQILAVRIHLDDCNEDNGALRVLPGTHQSDRLASDAVEQQVQQRQEVVCCVPAGGIILMKPLLLHASSPMHIPTSRRVIHFEIAATELPPPLQWHFHIPVFRESN